MAKRYAYTYTKRELNRRRLIGAIIGVPVWWLLAYLMIGFIVRPGIPLLIISFGVSVLLVVLTWQFNTSQMKKFTEVD